MSHYVGEQRRVEKFVAVPYDIPRGNVAAYFPEANPLVPIGSVAKVSNTLTSKYVVVRMVASFVVQPFSARPIRWQHRLVVHRPNSVEWTAGQSLAR